MNKYVRGFAVLLFPVAILAACISPVGPGETQPYSMDPVATMAAMTLQALAPEETGRPAGISQPSTELLPRSLYFLGNDSQVVTQIYRMERDGRTKTQLTFEPVNVWDYDVSLLDGSIAYETNNQLVLANADGSNRRVLVAATPNPDARGVYHPVFSPDGEMLAFAHQGLNIYFVSTGLSSLVIQDQFNDIGNGQLLPVETYAPERYSPDGTKLLLALGHWEVLPSHAVYDLGTSSLVRYAEVQDYIYCCSFHGGPAWSPDGSSFYGVASAHDSAYKHGEVWKVNATDGALTRLLTADPRMMNLPKELYPAPDGQLYFFLGTYDNASGFFDAPVLQLMRAAPDRLEARTVLRQENFVLMNEALWAPDASFVIVAMSLGRDWDLEGGVLELYYTDGEKDKVWLTSYGGHMKWGP